MTALDELNNYGCYAVPTGQRVIFFKNGSNPINNISLLKLNIRQANELNTNSFIFLEVGKVYKFYGVDIEIVDNLNDNLFWTEFTTFSENKFTGYLNARYLGILLERIIG